MKTKFDPEVWSCLVAIHTVLTHLTEHLVAKIYCWKMLRRGQFFRDIIYQCLTRLTSNIHSLLTLCINCYIFRGVEDGGGVIEPSDPSGAAGPRPNYSPPSRTLFHIRQLHSKLTSIIRHRSRCEVTLYKSPHSTSCPQHSPHKGRFFLLMHPVYFRNFHSGEAAMKPYFVFYQADLSRAKTIVRINFRCW